MIDPWNRISHAWRRWRTRRAARQGHFAWAAALLRRELYGDFTRTTSDIYCEMAFYLLAAGRPEEATVAIKWAESEGADTGTGGAGTDAAARRRVMAARILAETGKPADAAAKLNGLDRASLRPSTARRLRAAEAEIAIAQKQWDRVAPVNEGRDAHEPRPRPMSDAWRDYASARAALERDDLPLAHEKLQACLIHGKSDPDAAIVQRAARLELERLADKPA